MQPTIAVIKFLFSLSLVPSNAGQLTINVLILAFYGYTTFYFLNPNLLESHFKAKNV